MPPYSSIDKGQNKREIHYMYLSFILSMGNRYIAIKDSSFQ